MSNTLSEIEKKCLEILSSKNCLDIISSMGLSSENYNLLWLAHIATVLSESQGVRSLKIEANYLANFQDVKGKTPKDIPYMNCNIRVNLTNNGYITNTSYTGGSLTVWHRHDFGFYKASHVNTWIRDQVKEFKTLSKDSEWSDDIKLVIEKERKKDNSAIIYAKIIECIPEVRSILINYFLSKELDKKIDIVKKMKI